MKKWTLSICGARIIILGAGLTFITGCTYKTQGLFTMPSLTHCDRMAVLGLTEEQEQIFMASYFKTFSEQDLTFVERARLREIISEQDLLQGRLNDRTRAKMKEILGVKALILCAYYDASEGSLKKKLRVRVVDSDTGAILGSVITSASDNFSYHCYTAVRALKADLKNDPLSNYQTRNQYSSQPRVGP